MTKVFDQGELASSVGCAAAVTFRILKERQGIKRGPLYVYYDSSGRIVDIKPKGGDDGAPDKETPNEEVCS